VGVDRAEGEMIGSFDSLGTNSIPTEALNRIAANAIKAIAFRLNFFFGFASGSEYLRFMQKIYLVK
jgi:hypothetical protein